jgi:2-(1,2-epoxy-1,2-dihydrophenyl)acetyl-CoA isomerase
LRRDLVSAAARALTLLAEPLPAEKAKARVWKAMDDAELVREVELLCGHLAQAAAVGLARTKRALDAAETNDLSALRDPERDLQRQAGATSDFAEGVRAFLKNPPPALSGRGSHQA